MLPFPAAYLVTLLPGARSTASAAAMMRRTAGHWGPRQRWLSATRAAGTGQPRWELRGPGAVAG